MKGGRDWLKCGLILHLLKRFLLFIFILLLLGFVVFRLCVNGRERRCHGAEQINITGVERSFLFHSYFFPILFVW